MKRFGLRGVSLVLALALLCPVLPAAHAAAQPAIQYNLTTPAGLDQAAVEVDDRLCVPLTPAAQAFGCTQKQSGSQVTLTRGGVSAVLAPDSPDLTVRDTAGRTDLQTLSPAPFERNGTLYVPLRLFQQAFGMEVAWDAERGTALVLDRAALRDAIDADFTVLNRVLSAWTAAPADGVRQSNLGLDLSFELFDPETGNPSAALSYDQATLHDNACHVSAQVTLEADTVVQMLRVLLAGETAPPDDSDTRILDALEEALRQADLALILDPDTNQCYLRSAAFVRFLHAAADQFASEDLSRLPETAWLQLPALDLVQTLTGLGEVKDAWRAEYTSVGAICTRFLPETDEAAPLLRALDYVAQEVQDFSLLADWRFFPMAEGERLIQPQSAKDPTLPYGTVLVDADGGLTLDLTCTDDDLLFRVKGTLSPTQSDVTLRVQLRDTFQTSLHVEHADRASTASIPTAPPAGDTVIDLARMR